MNSGLPAYCIPCTQTGSTISVIRGVCNTYNDRIKELLAGNRDNNKPLDLGCPGETLLSCDLPNLPIQISVSKLLEKKDQCNHAFKFIDILHLPEYIFSPIAVFRSSSTIEDRKVILTEMVCDGVNIIVVVSPNKIYNGFKINDIRSVYPKDNIKAILSWVVEHNLLEYCNKQKFLDWLGKQRSNSAEVTRLIEETAKVIQEMDN